MPATETTTYVLDYAMVSTVSDEKHLGTFPPTVVKFRNRTTPTSLTKTPNPTSLAGKHGESNMLQILHKTSQQSFLENPAPPWTGNSTNPTLSGDDSTLGLHGHFKRAFLDRFVEIC